VESLSQNLTKNSLAGDSMNIENRDQGSQYYKKNRVEKFKTAKNKTKQEISFSGTAGLSQGEEGDIVINNRSYMMTDENENY